MMNKMPQASLWMTRDRSRYFLVPDDRAPEPGDVMITSLEGVSLSVSADSLVPFEITESQARRIAKHQLGEALGEIRASIDEKLATYRAHLDAIERTPVSERTTITPGAVPALIDLIKELPRAIGGSLSRDEGKLTRAREALKDLEARLKAAGIDVDGRLEGFADRLAALRADQAAPQKP